MPEHVIGTSAFNIPFDTSLKVEVSISSISTTEADEYCGAQYTLRS
jgi:hypothetical protein